ncbi:MAG: 30S ribosome-binding factor RbfA [Candidatus Dadabacteria bacterium]|nr:30S ribosome-binding factor RbfA [Candidatus Dadabacteria bacterium]NIQ16369.1 30S ribosome-binding factor RbfA [Candidatus Dadabacteria bacterium]
MKEVSNMIVRGDIKDPRVEMISITGVKVSDDMGYAKIFFIPLIDNSDKNEILEGLNSAKGYIRSNLSKRLNTKKVPKIEFEYDLLMDKGRKIDEIIRSTSSEEH